MHGSLAALKMTAFALDQPVLYPTEKVFRVGLRFFRGSGIVAILKYEFLQSNLRCVLRLKASGN